jgi:predicted nucleic acid-binding protein
MPPPDLFFDSSALFAGIVSAGGASRALLLLAEARVLTVTVSEQGVAETERAVARKVPQALLEFRSALRSTGLRLVPDPAPGDVEARRGIVPHEADVPIVVAAMNARSDYLVTLNRRHFLDDPEVAVRAGLPIGSPGDALAWVRAQLAR